MMQERGRATTPPRSHPPLRWGGTRSFSPHNIRARDYSPHLSPDRITRNISPGRQRLQEQNMEVVSRVPQMYRTSFSAITSPNRVPRRASPNRSFSGSQASFFTTPLRATMPGRIRQAGENKRSPDNQQVSSHETDSSSPPGTQSDHSVSDSQSKDISGTETSDKSQGSISLSKHLKTGVDRPSKNRPVLSSKSNDTSVSNVIQNKSELPASDPVCKDYECDEVKTKKFIEKEYVHIQDVSYFDVLKKKNDPVCQVIDYGNPSADNSAEHVPRYKKRFRSPFRLNRNKNNSSDLNTNNNGGTATKPTSEPNSPAKNASSHHLEGRKVRSTTLPSEIFKERPPSSPTSVKKSGKKKSKSITSFFQEFKRKLSPTTFRRQLSRSDKEYTDTPGSSGSLCTSQDDSFDQVSASEDSGDKAETPKHKSHKGKVFKTFLTNSKHSPKQVETSNSSKAHVNGDVVSQERNGATHPMPNDSNSSRILKSIEDNTPNGDKSVYQAFKQRQSPKLKDLSKEAAGLKPQALKVIEFPDRILNEDQGQSPPMQLLPHTTGSEPSLGSRNGNHVASSVSASKRTLVSQENMSPSNRPVATSGTPVATNSDPAHNTTASAPEASSVLPDLSDLDIQGSEVNFDNSPAKTPSYLNASRLASGYSPYSSYTPVLQTRNIKVLRKTESESDSRESSPVHGAASSATDNVRVSLKGQVQSEGCDENQKVPVTNGHVSGSDLDVVDSARICTKTVGEDSRTSDLSKSAEDDLEAKSPRSSHTVSGLNGLGAGELQLNLLSDGKLSGVTSPDTPAKCRLPIDGHYFLDVMRREEKKIQELCEKAESDLQKNHSEEVNGKLRATIGKANLLTSKKFNQFKGLCQKCNEPDEGDPFPILPKDLVGFWDMVSIQVDDVHTMFADIERMRLSGWTSVKTPTTTSKSSVGKGTARKSPRTKSATPSSSQKEARDKAREEARKRLLAAKKAGRMRKRSNSDKDEIEIFVPE